MNVENKIKKKFKVTYTKKGVEIPIETDCPLEAKMSGDVEENSHVEKKWNIYLIKKRHILNMILVLLYRLLRLKNQKKFKKKIRNKQFVENWKIGSE